MTTTNKPAKAAPPPAVKHLTSGQLADLSQKMLWQMSLGLEDQDVIAQRFGYTKEQYAEMAASKYFQVQMAALQAENERTGQNFRTKAGVMSQELMDRIFREAVSPETELKNRLDVLRTLAKYADWEPKGSVDVAKGPNFSISITLPPMPAADDKTVENEEIEDLEPEKASLKLDFGPKKAALKGSGDADE